MRAEKNPDQDRQMKNASILKRLQVYKDHFAAKVIGNIYNRPELLDNCGDT